MLYYGAALPNTFKTIHRSHGALSAARLNISMATTTVIDSWEINSAVP